MSRHTVFPISLYLRDRRVVVAGSGPDADRRADALSRAGAAVERHRGGDVDPAALRGVFAVFAHTGDRDADAAVADAARAAGALGYAHDQPERSDFAMPAVSRRGSVAFAVSTDGIAPGLAGHIRRQIDDLLAKAGNELDALVDAIADARRRGEPRSLLARIASRLRLVGGFHIDPPPEP